MRSKKFGLSNEEVKLLITPFFEMATVIIPTSTINLITRCPGDNRVLECAIDGNCKYIVTGDRKDLLSLIEFQKVEIITVKEFLKSI